MYVKEKDRRGHREENRNPVIQFGSSLQANKMHTEKDVNE